GDHAVVDVLAGERVAGTRPGVGEVDVDEGGLLAEAHAALEAALAVAPRRLGEGGLEGLVQLVSHGSLLERVWTSMVGRARRGVDINWGIIDAESDNNRAAPRPRLPPAPFRPAPGARLPRRGR